MPQGFVDIFPFYDLILTHIVARPKQHCNWCLPTMQTPWHVRTSSAAVCMFLNEQEEAVHAVNVPRCR